MADIKALVLGSKPREDTVQVCLDDGINAELNRLGKELGLAEQADAESFSGGNVQRILAAQKQLNARAAEHSITLHLRALKWSEAMDLEGRHPPRDENKADRTAGHNRETFYPALVAASTYKVTHADGDEIDATELDEGWWDALFACLNLAQFDTVYGAALSLNRRDAAAPFMLTVSPTSQPGGGGSAQPEPGGSAPASSTAGSRPRKRKSSSGTTKAARGDG